MLKISKKVARAFILEIVGDCFVDSFKCLLNRKKNAPKLTFVFVNDVSKRENDTQLVSIASKFNGFKHDEIFLTNSSTLDS